MIASKILVKSHPLRFRLMQIFSPEAMDSLSSILQKLLGEQSKSLMVREFLILRVKLHLANNNRKVTIATITWIKLALSFLSVALRVRDRGISKDKNRHAVRTSMSKTSQTKETAHRVTQTELVAKKLKTKSLTIVILLNFSSHLEKS